MPATNSNTGTNYGNTNKKQKAEIEDDIIDKLTHFSDVMRTSNSIKTSANFHLDSRKIDGDYKVEIQWRSGGKQTVALALVDENCTSLIDIQTGLKGSLASSTNWQVT